MKQKKDNHVCENCGSIFNSRQNLYKHCLSCMKKVSFKVSSCQKVFNRKDNLNRHQLVCSRKVSSKAAKKCSSCGNEFDKTSNLKRHLLAKTCLKQTFPCNLCNKNFSYKRNYDKHECFHQPKQSEQATTNPIQDPTPINISYDLSNEIDLSLNSYLLTKPLEDELMIPSMISMSELYSNANSSVIESTDNVDIESNDINDNDYDRNNTNDNTERIDNDIEEICNSDNAEEILNDNDTEESFNVNDFNDDNDEESFNDTLKKRLYRDALKIVDIIKQYENKKDQFYILKKVEKQLGLNISIESKPKNCDRELLPLPIRQAAWDFWHTNSINLTLTTRPAKLRIYFMGKVQTDLTFSSNNIVKNKRGIEFFESMWMITEKNI